jgi:hypothetical protein
VPDTSTTAGGLDGATVTAVGMALAVPSPMAARLKVKVSPALVLFAGKVTEAEGVPEEHERVLGRPVRVGVTENRHFEAPVTDPASLTVPPVELRTAGEAVNEPTVGAGGPATVTVTGVAVTEVFLP